MKKKTMPRLVMFMALLILLLFSGTLKSHETQVPRILLLVDDTLGAGYEVAVGKIKSIKSQLESFGWELIEAGIKREVTPCPWGVKYHNTKPFLVDRVIDEIDGMKKYHGLIILPGRDFKNLINNAKAIALIREAVDLGMPVAAWCRGVRLLAAADVIRNRRVIGNIDHIREYRAAGALAVEYSVEDVGGKRIFKDVPPPIRDGNIITTVRSLFYRDLMCRLIKETVDSYVGDIRQ